MAKPVAAYVQLPTDSGNTGKQIRTQTRVVSAQTVHEHFFARSSVRTIEGVYFGDAGTQTVAASATNGTTTGLWWLQNPAGATTNAGLRKVKLETIVSASTAMPTNPRISLALGTFTGTASGTAVGVAKRATADASAQTALRTASTGMTVTLGNIFWSAYPPIVAGTAGLTIMQSASQVWEPQIGAADDEKSDIVIAAGELVVNYQPDAGTASDSRKFDVCVEWSEFDNS